jgi:PD-(D/E)XK nuclease superfamily
MVSSFHLTRSARLFLAHPMNTDERRCPDSLTERVIGAILEVSNILGAGFLEKVYECALLRELGLRGIRAIAQASLVVSYKGQEIGEYCEESAF